MNVIEDPEIYILDDRYLAQEKMDGERRMVIKTVADIIGVNKKGTAVPLPTSINESISKLGIYDGEVIGGTLFVFDLLELEGADIKNVSCERRLAILDGLEFGSGIKKVETAYSTIGKRNLYNRLKEANAEGIVFKLKDSKYTVGRPASGGSQLKFKFHKTATFIVSGMTKGKRSVELSVIGTNGQKVGVGKVTIPPNKAIPNDGDFVEVRYLYAYKGGAIFQSVYLGKRDDCDILDAGIGQLIYKAEIDLVD